MMFIVLLACCSLCFADPAWEQYKLEFGKVYNDEEDTTRYETWKKNMADIEFHNSNYADDHGYTQGMNQFTDMTEDEFQANYIGCYKADDEEKEDVTMHVADDTPVPNSVDWRSRGYVGPVKNQGRCGSCYSFSATGGLEGQWFKKTGQLLSLSEKQIVDCSGRYGNMGCRGGRYQSSWQYLRDAGGSQSESSYPYQPRQGWCRANRQHFVAHVTGYRQVGRGENSLTQALASVGPVSVAIDASRPGFRSYRGGVFYDPRCSSTRLNHAVLAVGYGSEGGQDYYLVKNSWGSQYGVGGYVKMARNRNNNCGISNDCAYPTV